MNDLVCQRCRNSYSLDAPVWRCECGGLLDIRLVPRFDRGRIDSRSPTLWRYREALPISDATSVVTLGEGYTPLIPVEVGGRSVLVKQDQLFPTGSYKDRGAAVLISKAAEIGITHVVEDSSGNAGCAIAAYCARAGIACDIYVPEDTSDAKLAQIRYYGAELHRIPGPREATARAALEAAEETYYASHSWNPFFFHGTKTFAFEVCEQLGWQAPDSVVVPVGNGTLLLGCAIGFAELRDAGVIRTVPKLIGVQSSGCAPLAAAYEAGSDQAQPIQTTPTLAEGIAIAEPARGADILAAVRESGGHFICVAEAEIADALRSMGRQGLYIEPTAAAAIAGVKAHCASAPVDETIVTVFTGTGLKSTEKMLKLMTAPQRTVRL